MSLFSLGDMLPTWYDAAISLFAVASKPKTSKIMDSDPYLWTYLVLDRLPTTAECVQAVVSVSPSFGSKKQKDTVYKFATFLHNLWSKSFSESSILSLKAVKMKVTSHLKIYSIKVQKAKGNERSNMKKWYQESNELLDLVNKNTDPKALEKPEKDFYFDQKSLTRKMVLSKEIDIEFQKQEEKNRSIELSVLESISLDLSSVMNCSVNRSGVVRNTTSMVDTSSSTQTDENITIVKPLVMY